MSKLPYIITAKPELENARDNAIVATQNANTATSNANIATNNAENKIVDVESRFTDLTTQQQQESEVIDARKGKASLKLKVDEIDDRIGNLTTMPTTVKTSLAGAVGEVKNDLVAHKEEYTNQRQQDQFKVATVEKGLNDYKSTIANVNANQEAKQKVTGYGTISLPKNTANGQVSSISVKGRTVTNIVPNGDFRGGKGAWQSPSGTSIVTNNEFIYTTATLTGAARLEQPVATIIGDKYFVRGEIYPKYANGTYIQLGGSPSPDCLTIANQWNTYLGIVIPITSEPIRFYHSTATNYIVGDSIKFKNMLSINLTQTFGAGNEPTVEQCDKMFANYFDGTKSTISASRVKSVGKNLCDRSKVIKGVRISGLTGDLSNDSNFFTTGFIKIKSSTSYYLSGMLPTEVHSRWVFYDSNKNFIIGATINNTNILVNSPSGSYYVKISTLIDAMNTFQLEEGTVATPYEPYKESTQYLPNVGELRSLPNGVRDELIIG